MVANTRCGIFNKFSSVWFILLSFSFNLFISTGESEKKATSEPEISAEMNNSTNMEIIPVTVLILMTFQTISAASGSASKVKCIKFNLLPYELKR